MFDTDEIENGLVAEYRNLFRGLRGAHTRRETETTCHTLWPHVVVGGWYVIEDWAVGYWTHRPRFDGMVQLVTELVERAPHLSVSELDLTLAKGKALAVFRKGREGWSE